jgi:FtsZ-binding cell division protein ZapB
MSTPNALIDELQLLRQRLERLEEHSTRPRRGSLNLKQAAEFLNRSDEWLRREHAAGRGPKRRRIGRNYSYSFEDLDAYRKALGEPA